MVFSYYEYINHLTIPQSVILGNGKNTDDYSFNAVIVLIVQNCRLVCIFTDYTFCTYNMNIKSSLGMKQFEQ